MKLNLSSFRGVFPQMLAASIAVMLTTLLMRCDRHEQRSLAREAILTELKANLLNLESTERLISGWENVLKLMDSDTSMVLVDRGTHVQFSNRMFINHIGAASLICDQNELLNFHLIYSYFHEIDNLIEDVGIHYTLRTLDFISASEKNDLRNSIRRGSGCVKVAKELLIPLLNDNAVNVEKEFKDQIR